MKLLCILTSFLFLLSSSQPVNIKKRHQREHQASKPPKPPAQQPSPEQPLDTSPPNQEILPEPYRSVELLPCKLEGWYRNARPIEKLFRHHRIRVAIEVGCWLGLSTTHIAKLLPQYGKLYAIDHWEGSAELQSHPSLSTLYEQFLSNVIWTRLTDKIIPMRMNSVDGPPAIGELEIVPDLIYIDASHDFDSVWTDLNIWFPLVKGHGILCGDDWWISGVNAAVRLFAEENHLRIETAGNSFWRLVE